MPPIRRKTQYIHDKIPERTSNTPYALFMCIQQAKARNSKPRKTFNIIFIQATEKQQIQSQATSHNKCILEHLYFTFSETLKGTA